MDGAGHLKTALRYLRAMVRYLTMLGDSIHGIALRGNRFFEAPHKKMVLRMIEKTAGDTD